MEKEVLDGANPEEHHPLRVMAHLDQAEITQHVSILTLHFLWKWDQFKSSSQNIKLYF